jgi:hypothetical protein
MRIIKATMDPTSSIKSPGYNVENGDLWYNTTTSELFLCIDAGAGTWSEVAIAGSKSAQGAPAAIADGNTAITAANLLSRILTMASSTSGRAPTVPTGTALNAVVPTGDAIDWTFINTGNQTVTITQATGHTLVGTMTIAAGGSASFRTRISAANTAITYRL